MVTTPTRSRFAWRHPKSYLGIHGIVGLALSAACAWAFFWLADEIPEKGAIVRFDIAVTAWLQAHGTEPGESVFVGVSYLGAQVLIALLVVVAIVFVVRRDWRKLALLAVTCGGGALLNAALKSTFHRARPDVSSEFHVTSWSFPSGHAMDSFIVYGLLAYWLGRRFPRHRRWIFAAAAALVVAIGYARIYLGVHYLSDVLAGYSAGFVWLVVCVTGAQFADQRQIASPGVATGAGAARHPADSFSA
jgi:membrane-associated phospholipid phosphatase